MYAKRLQELQLSCNLTKATSNVLVLGGAECTTKAETLGMQHYVRTVHANN